MITVAKHRKINNLYNDDGTVGTPFTAPSPGQVYCDSCGSDSPQCIDVYDPTADSWQRGVPCPMHWSHPH